MHLLAIITNPKGGRGEGRTKIREDVTNDVGITTRGDFSADSTMDMN